MSVGPSRVLLDVSRLIWRRWSGRLPTGIDRVCLAYVEHFGARADAVIQWKGRYIVLDAVNSHRLMTLLAAGGPLFRRRLIALLGGALPRAFAGRPRHRQIYLNVGHTGLNDPGSVAWIARHALRAVHLIHDLIPIETPQFCRPGEAQRHEHRMTNALASASGIIGNSQATLDALRAFAAAHRLPDPPMLAAWLAGDALPTEAAPEAGDRPYFVVVGTIEGRKNHLLLLQLWQRLVERMGNDAPLLVLIGQRGWEAAGALAMLDRCFALRGAVIERGRCNDDELAGVIKGARALLMPSFAEGFGMPVIEALRLGTPVIASDLAVFREIAGTIPTFLPAHDAVAWEQMVLDFCAPCSEQARQIGAMRDYRAPDWPGHFAAIERWLAMLAA
ncbi:glycosyltransferase family 1 protein [Sphingomonas sp. GC_Shp_1]|uniref:glycosyltransferase family 4 protein n=1 Tax=unclassified Sphingomonas TaxID=196159 RepID=UPI00226B9F8A